MRLICSIIILLLQCVSTASFAAKGHTTNNGGNLAEIRFIDAWKTFEARMAPCLTPQNLCGLSAPQISALKAAIQSKAQNPITLPPEEALYRAGGEPKSENEMYEVVLSQLQACAGTLEAVAPKEIATRATAITQFSQAKLFRGQTWFVFQRQGLFVEYTGGVQDFTPNFRSLLRLPPETPVEFERVWMRNNGGMIEIGGRVLYEKGIRKNNGFTLLINPYEDGTIPERTDLTVFR